MHCIPSGLLLLYPSICHRSAHCSFSGLITTLVVSNFEAVIGCSLKLCAYPGGEQKMQPLPDGSFPYAGPVDCALKTLREEGPLKFYTGFPTYCIRSVTPFSSLFCLRWIVGRE
jgi:hypothetical protein